MLPEELSNDRCSLVPGEDRLAIVCEVFLYPGHSESHFQFHQAVIRSKARPPTIRLKSTILAINFRVKLMKACCRHWIVCVMFILFCRGTE